MRVIKRTGAVEDVSFDKVLNRIKNLSSDLSIDVYDISQKVCSRIFDNVKTSQLDELAAHICSSLIIEHPDYGVMASRIIISNHQKIRHLHSQRQSSLCMIMYQVTANETAW